MNILVTGGLGFIGSNFIKHRWNTHADRIINLDCETYAASHDNVNIQTLGKHSGGATYSWWKGDINNYSLVTGLLDDIDVVVHFAAESHVDRSISNSDVFIKSNINGTHNLLEAVRHVSNKQDRSIKFVHVSTDEVYGDLDEHQAPFTELSQIAPSSPYAASKASSDLLCLSYHRTHGLDVCVTRCSNNYGPNQHSEKLIPHMITNAIAGKNLPVYGTGRNIRDWIHVQDHCEAISRVISHGAPGETYNIGGEHEMRNIEIVEMILEQLALDQRRINYVTDRKGHDWRYAMDITKISTELNWRPKIKFEDGLRDLINKYKYTT